MQSEVKLSDTNIIPLFSLLILDLLKFTLRGFEFSMSLDLSIFFLFCRSATAHTCTVCICALWVILNIGLMVVSGGCLAFKSSPYIISVGRVICKISFWRIVNSRCDLLVQLVAWRI